MGRTIRAFVGDRGFEFEYPLFLHVVYLCTVESLRYGLGEEKLS